MNAPTDRQPLTLAFGGGGAKCVSQAGVLAVLEEAGLPIGPIVGVSGGGIVAVLYAAGFTPSQIRQEFEAIQLHEVWEPDPDRQALFGAARIRARFKALVGDKTFTDLRRPAVAMAMDLETAREVRMDSGPLADALAATMAIPGLFRGVERDEQLLVDCGALNPIPVDVARELGPRVVAVDVLHHNAPEEFDHTFEARGPLRYAAALSRRLGMNDILARGYQTAKIAMQRLSEWNLEANPPDVLLRPAVGPVGLFGFDQAEHAYLLGEAAARAALPQLDALARPAPSSRLRRAWRQFLQWRRKRSTR
jgi:NTE family protein